MMTESAQFYTTLDYPVLPIVPGDKRPLTPHGLADATSDPATLAEWSAKWPDANLAIATAGLVVIDVDGADNTWPNDPVKQRDLLDCPLAITPRGGKHFIFRQPAGKAWRGTTGRLAPGVDTRADGGYILVAPSTVNGSPYTWVRDLVSRAELPEPPAWLIEELDALNRPKAPTPEYRPSTQPEMDVERRAIAYLASMPPAISGQGGHSATYAAATAMVHGFALGPAKGYQILAQYYNPRCQPEWSERDLQRKCQEAATKPHSTAFGGLRDARDEVNLPAVDLSQFNDHQSGMAMFRPFPVEVLPYPIGKYINESAKAIGCNAANIALPILAALAAAVGNTRRIKLLGGWCEPAILWTGIVCESGQRKTPAIEAATKFLTAEETPEMRLVVEDVTRESLAGLLAVHPRGLIVVRDELAGWLSFAEYKKQSGGDVAFWLSLHGGKSHRVDRKGRNPQTGKPDAIFIPVASCSVTGGIQPGTLKRAITPQFFDNGLASRLLLAYPPKQLRVWTEDTVSDELTEQVRSVFRELLAIGFAGNIGGSIDIPLSASGVLAYSTFVNRHGAEAWKMTGSDSSLWAKLEGGAARLALVVHLVRTVTNDPRLESVDAVDANSIAAGVTISDWFGAEGLRLYDMFKQSSDDSESSDRRSEREEAKEWLRELLTSGSYSAEEAKKMAREEDIAERTLFRAKAELNVKSKRQRYGTTNKVFWTLAS